VTGGSVTGGDKLGADQIGTGQQPTVVLSLGSNVGDPLANLQLGLDVLASADLVLRAVSSVYQTEPVGGVAQADYLNAVVLAGSSLAAMDVLARCAVAETAAARVRRQRWGPRTLDVDIVCFGTQVSADPVLTLPHPRAHERAFVLVPWLELDPLAVLPGWGPVAALPAASAAAGVLRRPELRLTLPAKASPVGSASPAQSAAAAGPAGSAIPSRPASSASQGTGARCS